MKNALTSISLLAAGFVVVVLVVAPFRKRLYNAISSSGELTDEANPSLLENICKNYVVKRYSGTRKDVYGAETRQEVPNYGISTYGFVAKRGTFNNHSFVPFVAFYDEYHNGREESRVNIPFRYCVFGEKSNIIALDTTER